MGAPPSVVESGWGYTAWMLGGNASILLLFLINAIFRGAGDATVAMRSLWLANAVNLVLDPCLIFGLGPFPEMGITGAAIGTTVGRAVGVVYQFACSGAAGRVHRARRRHLRFDRAVMVRLFRVSVGGIVQFLIATASWLGLVRILTPVRRAALAGYTIALRIIVVAILPSWGMTQRGGDARGAEPGRGQARARRASGLAHRLLQHGLPHAGWPCVFIALPEPLDLVFTADPGGARPGGDVPADRELRLRLLRLGHGHGAGLQRRGRHHHPDLDQPVLLLALPDPAGLCPGPPAWTSAPMGVFLAITIAESLMAVVGICFFRKGRWKERVV